MSEKKCKNCGKGEYEVELLKYYTKGEKHFICTKCLPGLIHGNESCKEH